jgi:hypothetical protein
MNRFSGLLHPILLDAMVVAALSESKRDQPMLSKDYRLLTHDWTMDPDDWTDATDGQSCTHTFLTRGHLHTFVNKLQAEGWQIINNTGLPQTAMLQRDPSLEFWLFRRPARPEAPISPASPLTP